MDFLVGVEGEVRMGARGRQGVMPAVPWGWSCARRRPLSESKDGEDGPSSPAGSWLQRGGVSVSDSKMPSLAAGWLRRLKPSEAKILYIDPFV